MKEVRFLGLGKGLFFMNELRKPSEVITRIATIGVLSALGAVLMAFVKIPDPFAPWLEIEISEITTIIGYALYGLPGGALVAIIKTGLKLLFVGTSSNYLGELTAILASLMFIVGMFVTSHFKLFKKGLGFRIIAYVSIAILVSAVMTLFNAIFITPSYLTIYANPPRLTTCFEDGMITKVYNYLSKANEQSVNAWLYIGSISVIYLPFNLLKVAICFAAYEVLFNRLIFVFMRRSEFFQKWFVGNILVKKQKEPQEEPVENKQ